MPPPEPETAAASSIPSLVKDLVDQFDRPLDFYREMIQNAIDAGSNRIDVTLEYSPDQAVIGIEDDGEGMDEDVIDNHLLVLFRSTKEGDFTKIGKFGIGFVSVFAIQPDLVRVATAKNGQSWRLDFPSYKHYDKYRLSEPREGTLIQLFKKRMPRKDYDELVRQSRLAIAYWCKHSEAKIFFSDRSASEAPALITEEFDLPGGCSLRYQEEGTDVILGFSREAKPFCGFYNKGLTLLEEHRDLFPGVQFKAKSRYLEHTLTRDTIMKDDNYRKLIDIIGELVEGDLAVRLRAELEELARRAARAAAGGAASVPAPDSSAFARAWKDRERYARTRFAGLLGRWRNSDWRIFPTVSGGTLCLNEVRAACGKAEGTLYFDSGPNAITRSLETAGAPVLAAGDWVALAAVWLSAKAHHASRALILPQVLPDETLPAALRGFLAALRALDDRSGPAYHGILAADFDYPGSSLRDDLFVTQENPGQLSPRSPEPRLSVFGLSPSRRWALLNAGHPAIHRLAGLHQSDAGLAAFLGLKLLRLEGGDAAADAPQAPCPLGEKDEVRLLQGALRLGVASEDAQHGR